jgi:hypothetical protein
MFNQTKNKIDKRKRFYIYMFLVIVIIQNKLIYILINYYLLIL